MTVQAFWSANWTAAVVNHLWQSTVVIGVAWLLALVLRRNRARTRYWVWMTASVKFLVPFSLLISAGGWLRSLVALTVVAQPRVVGLMEQVTQPFGATQFFDATSLPSATHHSNWLPVSLLAIWFCGALVFAIRFGRGWWIVWSAKCVTQPLELAAEVPVLCSSVLIEPGIFGIFRPVLLLPVGILERLTPEQLQAIVAHEMCHVRRRDNLTFAIHMVVELLFWFHPLVWWIDSRLVEERERACDEAVLEAGGEAQVYAEGILNVCRFYLESPVACVAGVTGSDLKRRITRIMKQQVTLRLSLSKKILLGIAGFAALAAPLVVGIVCVGQNLAQMHAEDASAQSIHFEVASIRQNKSNNGRMTFRAVDDGVVITGAPVELLLQQAFGVEADRILGLPAWAKTDFYDIQAKVDDADVPRWKALKMARSKVAFQTLLASRFNFKAHSETRELPVCSLVVAKNGPKLHTATPGDTYPNGLKNSDGAPLGPAMIMGAGKITIQAGGMAALVKTLSFRGLGYPIEDRTGLTGIYDMTLQWTPGDAEGPDEARTSLSTALEEQLGLKLELHKRPIEVIVVDHIERPSPN